MTTSFTDYIDEAKTKIDSVAAIINRSIKGATAKTSKANRWGLQTLDISFDNVEDAKKATKALEKEFEVNNLYLMGPSKFGYVETTSHVNGGTKTSFKFTGVQKRNIAEGKVGQVASDIEDIVSILQAKGKADKAGGFGYKGVSVTLDPKNGQMILSNKNKKVATFEIGFTGVSKIVNVNPKELNGAFDKVAG